MFNVTVLRLKDIVKYIICIFVLILLIFSITNYFSGTKKNTEQVTQKVENVTNQLSSHSLLSCLDATLPVVASINHSEEKEKEKLSENDILKSMLETQISSIKGFKGIETPCIKIAENSYIPDFNSRYFRADFPYGLKILQEIGKITNVQTPYIDMIWFWFQQICFPTSYFKFSEYGINDINDFIDFYMD